MKVIAGATPLIALALLDQPDLLRRMFYGCTRSYAH
jgi:hypothetical protein